MRKSTLKGVEQRDLGTQIFRSHSRFRIALEDRFRKVGQSRPRSFHGQRTSALFEFSVGCAFPGAGDYECFSRLLFLACFATIAGLLGFFPLKEVCIYDFIFSISANSLKLSVIFHVAVY